VPDRSFEQWHVPQGLEHGKAQFLPFRQTIGSALIAELCLLAASLQHGETSAIQLLARHRPPLQDPRSKVLWLLLPQNAAGAHDERPEDDQATTLANVMLDQIFDAFPLSSQPLLLRLLRGPIESTQYLSIRYTERLAEAGVTPSVGSVGDSYDNELVETINGLFKAEVIYRDGPWKVLESVEYATLDWVDWFNNRRLLGPIGYIPPAEFEQVYYEAAAGPILGVGLK
jgi:hypothetical protein